MQSWFSVQAVCPLEGTLARVRGEMRKQQRCFFCGGAIYTKQNGNFTKTGSGQTKTGKTHQSKGRFLTWPAELMKHPMWTSTNTNFVRALVGAFRSNFQFHAEDGSGYEFLGDFIIDVDGEQDRMAAGMVSAFNTWRRLDDGRQQLVEGQLKRIIERPGVSAQVFEMATKILEAPRLGLRAMALAEMVGVEAP
jgi:aminopeptidase N